MKKSIVRVLIITIFMSMIFVNFSMAVDFADADKFISVGETSNKISDLTEIGAEFTAIGNVLKYIGAGIIVAATGYMGILYMLSPPERQAKLKKQLIGLVVAAVVIFGGYYIWKILVTALDTMMA